MNLSIEIPKLNDFNRVNELAKQVHDLHVKWRPDIFWGTNEVFSKKEFEEILQNKEIFVAKIQDEILGVICFKIKETKNANIRCRKQLSIEVICVDEKNRCTGIGTALLEKAKSIAKENKCTDLRLAVNQENIKAIRLYEKFGFKVKNIVYSMHI